MSSDSKFLITSSIDRTVRKWNLETGKNESIIAESNETIKSIFLSSDDNYLFFGRNDGSITIVSPFKLFENINILGHNNTVNAIFVDKSSKYLVSGSSDCSIKIHVLSEYPSETTLEFHKGEINHIEISNDNQYLASASHDHTIVI